jgi:tetratricopeptide (TPR) repeat protein
MRSALPPLALALAVSLPIQDARAQTNPLILRAHEALLAMELDQAREQLALLPQDNPAALAERALLAIHEGDCDSALALLDRAGLASKPPTSELAELARGCARVTAATTVLRDDRRGFVLRFKDEDDVPLAPFLMEVADRAVDTLDRELKVRLPRPLRIDVVRDHHSLAAMTGLPEESAQTTGTVAIAKWGRVTMLSPRAMSHGYGWADTLMHELTHLAVSRASHDRAPLWLQEGVAKRQETRWRAPFPFDDLPPPDVVARLGFDRGLALPLDKLGPSIAMLPTAEQAMVAFAEVHSFLRFWIKENGDDALGPFLHALASVSSQDGVDVTLRRLTGQDLAAWSRRWQASLAPAPASLPLELASLLPPRRDEAASVRPGAAPPAPAPARSLYRNARLAELLESRGHHQPALGYARRSHEAAPTDPSGRARLARTLRALGRQEEAAALVEHLDAVRAPHGLFLALHGALLRARGDESAARHAFEAALHHDPLSPEVACELVEGEQLPGEGARAALCRTTRRR